MSDSDASGTTCGIFALDFHVLIHFLALIFQSLIFSVSFLILSCVMRKPGFCIRKIKGADQLGRNSTADQHLCFRNIASTIPLLPNCEFSNL